MLSLKNLFAVALILVHGSLSLASDSVAPEWRTWTRTDGDKVQGMLMNVTADYVILLTKDIGQTAIKRNTLEPTDRKVADSFLQKIAVLKTPIATNRVVRGLEVRQGEVPAQLPNFPAMTFEVTFRNDVPHGLAQFRTASGAMCQVEPQHDGQIHGTKVLIYPTGEIYALIFMEHGVPVGLHPRFFPNGVVATLSSWQNGEQHGFYIAYHKNGTKRDVYPLVHGRRHGESVHFTSYGKRYGVQKWEDGNLLDKVVFHEIDAREYAEITANIPEFGEVWNSDKR